MPTPPRPTAPTARSRLRPRLLGELTLLVVGYIAYALTRVAVRGDQSTAIANGQHIYRIERHLRLDPEQWLNGALSAHTDLSKMAGYYYASFHFVVTAAMLVWLYWRQPASYRSQRTVLILTTVPALAIFWWFPAAPPRFALHSLTDTLATFHILEAAAPRGGTSLANLNAAMPSLHVAWAAWAALALWRVFRTRYPHAALLAFCYPLATILVVISTANHYLLDALAGLALLGLATFAESIHRRTVVHLPVR
jgi:hypothetical protein